jgi:hypothetical protein
MNTAASAEPDLLCETDGPALTHTIVEKYWRRGNKRAEEISGTKSLACRSKLESDAGSPPSPKATAGNLRVIIARRLVEAAGVEPASESTASKNSTCVSASFFSYPA